MQTIVRQSVDVHRDWRDGVLREVLFFEPVFPRSISGDKPLSRGEPYVREFESRTSRHFELKSPSRLGR